MALKCCTTCGSTALWGADVAAGHTTCRPCRKAPVKRRAPVKVDTIAQQVERDYARLAAAKHEALSESSRSRRAAPVTASTAAVLELVDPARGFGQVKHKLGPVASYQLRDKGLTPTAKVTTCPAAACRNLVPKTQSRDRGWVQGDYSSTVSHAYQPSSNGSFGIMTRPKFNR